MKIKDSLNADSYYWSLRGVDVKEDNGHILLSGIVKSYFMKQLAQEIAMRHLNGNAILKNHISVE
jgi:osmotically-inducible protein OsmY